jgi:hypothetical protein
MWGSHVDVSSKRKACIAASWLLEEAEKQGDSFHDTGAVDFLVDCCDMCRSSDSTWAFDKGKPLGLRKTYVICDDHVECSAIKRYL